MLRIHDCGHWVVATGQRHDASGWWYYIVDPGNSGALFNGWLHESALDLCPSSSAVVLKPRTGARFGGSVHSPLRTTIIDPLGRRVVVDSTGVLSQEISDVEFEVLLPTPTLGESWTPEETEQLLINAPYSFWFDEVVDGDYQIQLEGTAQGEYTVDMSWFTESDEAAALNLEGVIAEGEVLQHTVKVRVTSCLADFDGDGFVTGVDFDLFVGAFEQGDMAADFDLDGFVTGADFDLFVQAFEAGC